MKKCTSCELVKPESDFGAKNPKGRKPGLQPQCRVCRNRKQRERNAVNPEYAKRYREQNRELRNANRVKRYRILRDRAIAEYGAKCVCCGEDEQAFLVFDHVNDDGAEHRKSVSSGLIVWWLAQNDYPDTIQLLCANCNMAKQYSPGGCPHQSDRPDRRDAKPPSIATSAVTA